MNDAHYYEPAQPEKMLSRIMQNPRGFAVIVGRGRGAGWFLLLWLIAWTVGCVFLLGMVIKEPTISNFMFGVPFWVSWLAVAGFLIWLWFGKETLLINPDKVLFLRQALITISTRAIPASEIQGFRECLSRHTENDQHLRGIELQSAGKPLQFGFRLPERERKWLLHELNLQLAQHCRIDVQSLSEPPDDFFEDDEEVLTPESSAKDPPSDSSWELIDGIDEYSTSHGVQIRQRGRWQIVTLFILLFINGFWNGPVAATTFSA